MNHLKAILLTTAAFLPLASAHAAPARRAVVTLRPLGDHKASGALVIDASGDALKISGKVDGLTPGQHGFHVHEFGDCSSPDGKSAGDHFNPSGAPHAGPKADIRHAGDLGNLSAGEDGVAAVEITDTKLALDGDRSIVGRSILVHEKADDLKTQPSGDSGARISCGVVGLAKSQ